VVVEVGGLQSVSPPVLLEPTAGGVARLAISAAGSAGGPTRLRFDLGRTSDIRLEVFDLRGRRVRSLATGWYGAGTHVATWDGRDARGTRVGSGAYFARITAGGLDARVRFVVVH
jgi:hypothetical protein